MRERERERLATFNALFSHFKQSIASLKGKSSQKSTDVSEAKSHLSTRCKLIVLIRFGKLADSDGERSREFIWRRQIGHRKQSARSRERERERQLNF